MKPAILIGCLLVAFAATAGAQDKSFKELEESYDQLHVELLNNAGEKAEIANFVYHKDAATFTFEKGTMYLQRFVHNRPTTAIFVGTGHVTVDIPVHTERQGLWGVTKDSTVDQAFELLAIRMADDFDLRLKEQFGFAPAAFDWRALAKSNQGEVFFKPLIFHNYDNYFRLLMSIEERGPDGFFWADFNRYTFTYDPNWPEQVQIGYEHEGGDQVATVAASFLRQSAGCTEDTLLSQLPYPTTPLNKSGRLTLAGTDGRRLDQATVDLQMLVIADSLKYTWFYLKYNLDVDSVFVGDTRLGLFRRKTFDYTGIVLPRYYHKGDTVTLTVWYHGSNFDHFLPYLSDPAACPVALTFNVPSGYTYFTAGKSETVKADGGKATFTSEFPAPLNNLYFHCYATGISDTVEVISDIGLTLNYIIADRDARNQSCFIPHDKYRPSVTGAFNFMSSRFGQPPQTFAEYVIPEGFQSVPGMIKVPQVACITTTAWDVVGGLDIPAGDGVARQWFGALMRLRSSREDWLTAALPAYMGLQYIESARGGETYFLNLMTRRDSLYERLAVGQDIPLAAGTRVNSFKKENFSLDYYQTILTNRGIWLLHMLRFLMYDYDSGSEATYLKFLRELGLTINNRVFSNADFIRLAEKHYGQPLDWFFRTWLYSAYIPEFSVTWATAQRDGNWYVPVQVQVAKTTPDFTMPVICRVSLGGENAFSRQVVSGATTTFELGPFNTEPKEFIFNEFLSVLGRQNVSKK